MIVVKGKNNGFCFGVKRAVESALSLKGERNFVLGEIIHNESVNRKINDSGIKTISDITDNRLSEGDTVLIRTHGEPKSTFKEAERKKLKVIDCTCPFVKEIHNIVESHYNDGYRIAIIGNSEHPEIKGINGWCNNTAVIVDDIDDLNKIEADKLCIVVQTTYSEEKFDRIIKNFEAKRVKTVDIFKTICYTTKDRQKEADLISKKCEATLVVGGENSNNTEKLFEICKRNSENVFRITDPLNFEYKKLKKFYKVGIILGASTPDEQFQEVISSMEKVTEDIITTETIDEQKVEAVSENAEKESETVDAVNAEAVAETVKEEAEEEKTSVSAKSEMEAAFDKIKPNKDFRIGQIVRAKISSANENGLTVSVNNAKVDFELPKEELLNEYNKEDYKDKIGEEIRVMVVGKKPLKFSEKAMEKVLKEEADIDEIRNGKIFEVQITETNKGGLTGKYGSYQVFVPASQIKLGFVKDLDKYVGKTLRLKAEKVESRGARRQIVGSQKVILEAEKQERDAIRAAKEAEFFESVQEGDVVLGTPVRFTTFGAFIDVNGFDCLAHISDLSWTGCEQCSDVLEIGKQYEFIILKINQESKRVSLGYKQLQPKPWDSVAEKYKVGDVITAKVVRLVGFGAFVEVEKGVDGLVHVSQISNEYLENPATALQVGQEITAKIMDINVEKEKMNLSIKALIPEEPKPEKVESKAKKGKKDEDASEEPELREWKEEGANGVSIAEMLGNNEE